MQELFICTICSRRGWCKSDMKSNNDVGEGLVPSRKPTRLKNFDYAKANAVFFITLCSLNKRQIFVKNEFNTEVIEYLKSERKRVGHAVYVFCLMPEHLHLLLSPLETGNTVIRFMGALSSQITRLSWRYGFSGRLLQRSFYDHIIRKHEDLRRIAEYILANPVRRGLIERWQDYQYCGLIDPLPW